VRGGLATDLAGRTSYSTAPRRLWRTGMRSVAGDLEEELFALTTVGDGRALRATHVASQLAVRRAPVLPDRSRG